MDFGVFGIFQFFVFTIVRIVFEAIQFMVWKVGGIARQVEETKNSNYETGAQLLDIYWRGCNIMQDFGSHNFITTHNSFVHPNIVLSYNVSLFSLTDTEALFIRASQNKKVWSSDVNAFMYTAQFDHAEQLIIVPIKHFHRLAEEIGRPKIPVLFLFNTGRCGSTLLTQVFEAIPGGISMSEPYWLNMLSSMKTKGKNIDLLVRHCVNICCKPRDGVTFYCVKLMGFSIHLLDHVARENPDVHLLYMYRKDTSKFVISLTRMLHSNISFKMMAYVMQSKILSYFCPKVHNLFLDLFCYQDLFPWAKHELQNVDQITLLFVHLGFHKVYVLNTQTKCNIAGIRYEDLLEHRVESCNAILEYCHMPTNNLKQLVQTAFGRDSQRGTHFDKEKMNKFQIVITEKKKQELQLFADRLKKKYDFDMPVPGTTWCLPNTITTI